MPRRTASARKLMAPGESQVQYLTSEDREEETSNGFQFANDVKHGLQLLGMISDTHAANPQIELPFPCTFQQEKVSGFGRDK